MTAQLQQAIRILQLSASELAEEIERGFLENPLLEMEEGDGASVQDTPVHDEEHTRIEDAFAVAYDADDPYEAEARQEGVHMDFAAPVAFSLEEELLREVDVRFANLSEKAIAVFLVGSLDERGYLVVPLAEAACATGTDEASVERILRVLQSFDPAGIGARDLAECMRLQAERTGLYHGLLRSVIEHHLRAVAEGHYREIARAEGASLAEVQMTVDILRSFSPKPGSAYGGEPPAYIRPDVRVVRVDGRMEVTALQAQVLVVAPIPRLAEEVRRVIAEQFRGQEERFTVVEADLREAEALVARGGAEGYEVVVSRGGTAELMERLLDIPVVHIQVSLTDILRAVRTVETTGAVRHVGVSGFPNMIYGCTELSDLLPIEVTPIEIHSAEEAEEKLRARASAGGDVIVGDAVSVRIARSCGMCATAIDSGLQAIHQALAAASLIAFARGQDELKTNLLRGVVDKSQDGIVAVNAAGEITLFNPEAERIFQRARYEVMGRRPTALCADIARSQRTDEERIVHLHQKQYLVKRTPVTVRGAAYGSIYRVQSISEVQRIERTIRKKLADRGLVAKWHMEDIEGVSASCQTMKHKAEKYARTDSTVLITGESGTGKEMLAQGIHNRSRRKARPFFAVNCAALPENLLESELFGYVEGAFTGARKGGRQGLFELAHGGTIFLDEIGEMPALLQTRLLRVLQEREVMPFGGESIVPIDVRVIAATNQNLARMVEAGTFRSDLYYHLNILRIHMPALAERRADIPLLARSLMRRLAHLNGEITGISDEAVELLRIRPWPGNIRQLQNMMERLMLLADGAEITVVDVRRAEEDDREEPSGTQPHTEEEGDGLHRILVEEHYNLSRAAKRLGIHRTTLWRRMKNMK